MSNIEQVIKTVGEGEDRYESQMVGGIELRRFIGRGDGEWRQRDLDLGRQLEFSDARKVRQLIKSLERAGKLKDLIVLHAAGRTSTDGRGGRRPEEFWLTEAQSLKVAAKSETDVADEILDRIINVYQAVKNGSLAELQELHQRMVAADELGRRRELEGAAALQQVQEQMADLKTAFLQEIKNLRADKEAMGGMPLTDQWVKWLRKSFSDIAIWRSFVNKATTWHSEHQTAQDLVRTALSLPLIPWEDLPMVRMSELRIVVKKLWKQARNKAKKAGWTAPTGYHQPDLPGLEDDDDDDEDGGEG